MFLRKLIFAMFAFAILIDLADLNADAQEFNSFRERLNLNYFSVFSGPGLCCDLTNTPGQDGTPSDEGINLFNIGSVRFRPTRRSNIDLQSRVSWIMTNAPKLRWESMRLAGAAQVGTIENLAITVALNSDLPGPVANPTLAARKLVLNPGLFANLNYTFGGNGPWSLFTTIGPRYFIYSDAGAIEQGGQPGRKTHAAFIFTPTVNRTLSSHSTATVGSYFEFRKMVMDDWNQWIRRFVNVYGGVSYTVNAYLTVFPYLEFQPVDGLGVTTRNTFFGIWFNGNLL